MMTVGHRISTDLSSDASSTSYSSMDRVSPTPDEVRSRPELSSFSQVYVGSEGVKGRRTFVTNVVYGALLF